MLYSYCIKLRGKQLPTHIEIIYMIRPSRGKTSPKTGAMIGVKKPNSKILIQPITEEDWDIIENFIEEVRDTLRLYDKMPEVGELLFRRNMNSYFK